MLNYTVNMFDR